MTRNEILRQAKICVSEGRVEDYGDIKDNFGTIASLWEAYLKAAGCVEPETALAITAGDVAIMMCLLKIGRAATGLYPIVSNFVDLAGYAACAGELLTGADDEDDPE
jgi:hypothetical protein